jgi:hypothetical protein
MQLVQPHLDGYGLPRALLAAPHHLPERPTAQHVAHFELPAASVVRGEHVVDADDQIRVFVVVPAR